ncbi:folate family ECF transporter S component [uncultured Oscillibacter sp.]|uniref:folate family ECF transporter S component n=1 Tax=uncultured Oscillibacter sp. TaxID=876091 RepID=UPI0025D3EFA8|nr:folate family ECF transporter S component [uncultured Oscillibacter sp.]
MPGTNVKRVRRLCCAAMLAAMYLPLSLYAAVQVGNVRISFGSLPVVVAALLFGPLDAVVVAMVGEFFKQILTFGVTYTTALYLIPPALRGLVVGAGALLLRKRGQRLEERRTLCYGVCVLAAVHTTVGNTLVNWLDSVLMGYYFPGLILGDLVWRLAVGMLNAVLMAALAIPLVQALRRRSAAWNF